MESKGETHGFRANPRLIIGGVAAVVLLVFILSNRQQEPVQFLFLEATAPMWVTLTVTALLGAAVGAGLVYRRQRRRARG